MNMKGIELLSLGILLASLCQSSVSTQQNKCPNIHVGKNEIIQVKASLRAGAVYLSSKKTTDARDCYQLCCDNKRCDLAQLQYKNNTSSGAVERTCYLFECGHPTKCSFGYHEHHATIHFSQRGKSEEVESVAKLPLHRGGCPPGVPQAMCLADPCVRATCAAHEYATCKANLCGYCRAEFFNDDGVKVDCDVVEETDSEEKDLETSYEQGEEEMKGEVDHRNNEKKLLPTKEPVYHFDKTTKAVKYPDVHKFSFEEFEGGHKLHSTKKTTIRTVKPTTTEKPTTFHQWREFIDNNPNFPVPTGGKEVFQVDWESRASTSPPTERETPAKVYPPTHKETPIDKYNPSVEEKSSVETEVTHEEELTTKKVVTTSSPEQEQRDNIPHIRPPVMHGKHHKNVTDVVLIENNHLKIVENKAVLPLAIFLVVAILLLFVVALRLRVVKNKLRRRPFATDDADYLINGMYL